MRRSGGTAKKLVVILCLILFLGIMVAAISMDNETADVYAPVEQTPEECFIQLVPMEEQVYLVNNAVVEWMEGEYSAKALHGALREEGRLDTPIPLVVAYSIENIPVELTVQSQTVEVSETEDFENPKTVSVEPQHRRAMIYNLRTNKQYYYRVTVTLSDGRQIQAQSAFRTADSPRYLQIDGIRNCRDLGGYKTTDGKRIRQGMLFRGTELDGAGSNKYIITEAGVDTLVGEFGLRTEIDLRSSSVPNVKDTLGESVDHIYYSFLSYSEIFKEYGKGKVREIFAKFAEEESYPMYIHCTYGADRTGTVCYLVEALLGLSEEDLYREWELSAFLVGGAFEEDMANFVKGLNTFEGDTMQEKVENYLLSAGVTPEEIANIRRIMLTEE